jgi:hypothetical protein
MSVPRDHHFLPVFYLKQWASYTDGKLLEYTIKHGKLISKRVGPRGTGFETDLYSFPELPNQAAQYLESVVLQDFDNKASSALQQHLRMSSDPWDAEIRSAWSRFVMGLILRHPDVMQEIRVAAKSLWDKGHDETQRGYEAIRKPNDPVTFEEYMVLHDPTTELKARLNMIIRAFDNIQIGTHINSMKWAIVDLTGSPDILLTSDRPVTRYALSKPSGSLFLPISPRKLFLAANDQSTIDDLANGDEHEIVKKANALVVRRARRYVYSRDKWLHDFIKDNMSKEKETTPLFPDLTNPNPDRSIIS